MERAAISDVETFCLGADSEMRRVTDALGAEHVAVNHYRLAPGDELPSGLHAHTDQEEVFVVLSGEATFEVCASPLDSEASENQNREITVETGEAIRFAPGDFQSGRNAGGGGHSPSGNRTTSDDDEEVVALALGAPAKSEDVRIPFACPDCGDGTLALDFEDEFSFACPDCGAERVPTDCPVCGCEDLRATLNADNAVVVACTECDAEYDRPPIRGGWNA